jgi:hypothetical protein
VLRRYSHQTAFCSLLRFSVSTFSEIFETNHSAISLLSHIYLYRVDGDLLVLFLNKFRIWDLTEEVFEVLKSGLVFNVSIHIMKIFLINDEKTNIFIITLKNFFK